MNGNRFKSVIQIISWWHHFFANLLKDATRVVAGVMRDHCLKSLLKIYSN